VGKFVLFLQDGTMLPIPLDKERIVIGRRADNDVCLPYPAVSGEHAQVVTILADSFLEDLGSTNGTLVNGKPVAKHFLRDRDQIDIGRQRLIYLADNQAVVESPGPSAQARTEARTLGERVPKARGAAPARRPAPLVPDLADLEVPSVEAAPAAARVATTAIEPPPAPPAPEPEAPGVVLRVLSGPSTGRLQALDRDETALGRVGVQVARIRRDGAEYRLVPVEGDIAPRVNGAPVGSEGVLLKPGDLLEVAGTRIEFGLPPT
jgi:pSer/pThr/pTyr-binding forkhead associated (FHA) protein